MSGPLVFRTKTVFFAVFAIFALVVSAGSALSDLYVVSVGDLYKVDSNGNILWNFTDRGAMSRVEGLSDGDIVVGGSSYLVRLDSDGQEIWANSLDTTMRELTIDNSNNIIIGGVLANGGIQKFDSDGNLIWSVFENANSISDQINSLSTDQQNNIYVGDRNEELRKLNPSGNVLWTFTDFSGRVTGLAAFEGGVIAGSWDNTVRRINSDGNEIWSVTEVDRIQTLFVANNRVFISVNNNDMVVRDLDGNLLDSYDTSGNTFLGISGDSDGNIYGGGVGGNLFKLNESLEDQWTLSFAGNVNWVSWNEPLPNFTITSRNSYDSSVIEEFNVTLTPEFGVVSSYSTTDGVIVTDVLHNDTGLWTVEVNAPNYFSETFTSYNVSENLVANLTPWTEVFARAIADNSTINNFTAVLDGVNYSTTTGSAFVPLFDTTAEVTVQADGFALRTESLTASPFLQNATFELFPTNTVTVDFRDEQTNEKIDDREITAFFTGDFISYNVSTENASLQLEMIDPQPYVVTYNAENYTQRRYSFTLTNRTFETLTLYLLKDDEGERILTNVRDSFLSPVADATVFAQRRNLSGTNFFTVESCSTDNSGECVLNLELFDPTYRFIIERDGKVVFTSTNQEIKSNTISFIVDLQADIFGTIISSYRVRGNINYAASTNTFSFEYQQIDANPVTACLAVTRRHRGVTNEVALECASGTSTGTISAEVDTNTTGEFTARGYVLNSPQNTVASMTIAGLQSFGSQIGLAGLFLFGFFIMGVGAFAGLFNPVGGPIIIVSLAWLLNFLGLISIGMASVATLAVAAAMVILLTRN